MKVRPGARVIRAGTAALAVAFAFVVAPSGAFGQTTAGEARDIPAERFRLALDADGILDVESGAVPTHLSFDIALWLGYANDPLVIDRRQDDDQDREGELVGSRVGAELVFSLALFEWVQLGIDLPLILYQDRQDSIPGVAGLADLSSAGFGSPRFVPKVRILNQDDHGLHLAIMPTFVAPSLQSDAYFGQDTWTFEPELAGSRSFGLLVLGANVGYRVRREKSFANLEVDDELFARIGGGLRFDAVGGPPLGIDLSLAGATSSEKPLARGNRDYGELLGGLRYNITRPLIAFAGGGVGVNRGFGTPDWRVFAGLRWSSRSVDTDKDGIIDTYDACPDVPEDFDSFEDTNGCPDYDNDRDGINDVDDGAPMRPEDKDGFEDSDGVPDVDNDKDTVMDWDDGCPMEPGPVDNRGCPDVDTDVDGLVDRIDGCPKDPEDKDDFRDEDGCPDPDNDLDGIEDGQDACPLQVGPEANRGCPDTDADGDTVVDREDNCPTEAGLPQYAGCKAPQPLKITGTAIIILDQVHFDTGKATIQRRSYKVLNGVANVLKNHPEIQVMQIEGHTDSTGRRSSNLRLSDRRAKAVRRYLISKGVAAGRLKAAGFGPDRPVASNATKSGRAANRRVEFNILSRAPTAQ